MISQMYTWEIRNDMPILRDDFAPVNSYIADLF
jgi:hypothetical protein